MSKSIKQILKYHLKYCQNCISNVPLYSMKLNIVIYVYVYIYMYKCVLLLKKDIYVKIYTDPSPFFNHQHIATIMISTGIIDYVYFIVIVI